MPRALTGIRQATHFQSFPAFSENLLLNPETIQGHERVLLHPGNHRTSDTGVEL